MPKNISLIFLPSRSPELNPVENAWQYLRANWLSNRVFDTKPGFPTGLIFASRSIAAAEAVVLRVPI